MLSAGLDVWAQAVAAYTQQLIQAKDLHRAVMYLLSIHKIPEAIQLYTEAEMFP